MFINLSNHPSSAWEAKQIEVARRYGEIVDIPFPQVNPENSHQDIEVLADKYAAMIENMGKETYTIVHIMGEMTFVFALVSRLKGMGIKCVASTTERIATELEDGTKLSEFSFVNFREY